MSGPTRPRIDRDRTQRVLNGVALLLIGVGVATYGFTLRRMDAIRGGDAAIVASKKEKGSVGAHNLDQFWATKDLSDVALGIAGLGVAVAIGAAVRQTRRTKRLANGQANHS